MSAFAKKILIFYHTINKKSIFCDYFVEFAYDVNDHVPAYPCGSLVQRH